MTRFFATIAALGLACAVFASPDWAGRWEGRLMGIRLVFNIQTPQDGCLTATLDSPDQGATGIPVDTVITHGDSISLSVKALRLSYSGVMVPGDSLIRGTLTQGMQLKLDLRRKPAAPLVRVQTLAPPYPYLVKDVEWTTASGDTVRGTLSTPSDQKPLAAAVILSGSGQQDRDGTMFGHKPYLVLADSLTRAGVAVLRYDDSPRAADMAAEEAVALQAVAELRRETGIKKVWLIGHSLGGAEALQIAAEHPSEVAGVVGLCAPVVDGVDLMVRQNQAIFHHTTGQNMPVFLSEQTRRIFATIDSVTDPSALRRTLRPLLVGKEDQLEVMTMPMYVDIVRSRPGRWLDKVRCPVLMIWGEDDLQVDAAAQEAILASLGKRKNVSFFTFRVNHLLQPVTDRSQRLDYSGSTVTIAGVVLSAVTAFITAH